MNHITYEERKRIEQLVINGYSERNIGRHLARDHTVISREIRRNAGRLPYSAERAQLMYEKKLRGKKEKKMESNFLVRGYVIEKLENDWSPQQISGRLREYEHRQIGATISHETIYQFIYSAEGRSLKLFQHLRTKRPRRWQKCSRRKKILIPERVSIHERPAMIGFKREEGHWESDLMIFSKQKTCLSVEYEKKLQLCRIKKIPNKKAESKYEAIMASMDSLPLWLYKTITFDNGTENVKHVDLERESGIETYFCDGYASWQKGGVENMNKLIRQYFPRYENLEQYTDEAICYVQEQINNRPRKGLNYLTPNEMLLKHTSGAFTT